jgi:hypothetical protein
MWRGTWLEAEQELSAAAEELDASRPAMTGDALVRLGELRRRQGRLVDAARLFDQADGHPLALLGRAELAIDRGDTRAAAELAERYLRRLPAAEPDRSRARARAARPRPSPGPAISTARAPRSPSCRPSRRS